MLWRFWSEERASETTSTAILAALGAVVGLAVLTDLGYHLYEFFHHVGQCLNGC